MSASGLGELSTATLALMPENEQHEGDRLLALLKAHGKTQVDLANAAAVSRQAVSQWVSAKSLRPQAFETCRKGLTALGIDPGELRPALRMMERRKRPEDLRPYTENFKTRRQIEDLLRILAADDDARDQLRVVLEERLKFLH